MKITLEPTSLFTTVNNTRCRVWQGDTEKGVPIHALVVLVGVDRSQDAAELDGALKEVTPRPELDVYRAIDLRMVVD